MGVEGRGVAVVVVDDGDPEATLQHGAELEPVPRRLGEVRAPLEEITPSAARGARRPKADGANRLPGTPVRPSTWSRAPMRALIAASGPSRTRLGLSTNLSTKNRPEPSSTVALLHVPPLSNRRRPMSWRSPLTPSLFASVRHAGASQATVYMDKQLDGDLACPWSLSTVMRPMPLSTILAVTGGSFTISRAMVTFGARHGAVAQPLPIWWNPVRPRKYCGFLCQRHLAHSCPRSIQ